MKRVLEVLGWLTAVALFAFASRAVFAQQQVDVTVRQAQQSPEQRVADEVKEKQLRKAAEERIAEEESARLAEQSPRALLARARTVYVASDTSYFEEVQLQNELRKRDEFDAWQLVILDGYERRNTADLIVVIDRPLFTFTFTYKLTDRATGIVLAAGKVTAFDGNAAAPKLASRVIEELRRARGESKEKNKEKKKK